MAIDKRLKIYDDQGHEVDYDIMADDVKFSPDGKDLPTKLAEMEEEIGEGGYTPPADGIPKTDLAPSVQTSLDKADTALQQSDKTALQAAITQLQNALNALIGGNVQGAIDTFNEVTAFLANIDTSDPTLKNQLLALNTAITNLGNSLATVATSGSYNDLSNKPTILSQQDVAGMIEDAIEDLPTGDTVSVTTNNDGTFTIHVGETDYTINLNHTHEGMAKLVKDDLEDLPDVAEMDEDTIYAGVEDGEVAVLYIGGIPFYGGGSSSSEPVLRQPADGSTINVDELTSGALTIKGKNLTQPLTIAVTGDFTVNGGASATVSATDANLGTTVTLACTSQAEDAAGTLSIASSEVSCDCDLIANVPEIATISAIKLTGTQWLKTDYKPNPLTEFGFDIGFQNVPASGTDISSKGRALMTCPMNENTETSKIFRATINSTTRNIVFSNEESSTYSPDNTPQTVVTESLTNGRGTFSYEILSNSGIITLGTSSHLTSKKTTTMQKPLMIGYGRATNSGTDGIFTYCDLVIYGLVITENGTTVRNYVPAKRGSVAGLHETVTDTFITSETSTNVVAVE